jgi:hypothetical protein
MNVNYEKGAHFNYNDIVKKLNILKQKTQFNIEKKISMMELVNSKTIKSKNRILRINKIKNSYTNFLPFIETQNLNNSQKNYKGWKDKSRNLNTIHLNYTNEIQYTTEEGISSNIRNNFRPY